MNFIEYITVQSRDFVGDNILYVNIHETIELDNFEIEGLNTTKNTLFRNINMSSFILKDKYLYYNKYNHIIIDIDYFEEYYSILKYYFDDKNLYIYIICLKDIDFNNYKQVIDSLKDQQYISKIVELDDKMVVELKK